MKDLKEMTKAEIEALALKRVNDARAELILTERFYGVLVTNVEPKLSYKFPTAATNGKVHYWNPGFVTQMTPKQTLTVTQHETEHDARHHSTRRGNRDHKEWNIACDYAINIDLIDAGGEFPAMIDGKPFQPYVDKKYRGWSAEEIYRAREIDRKREEEEKRQQAEQEAAAEQEKEDDESSDDDSGASDNQESSEAPDQDTGEEDSDSETDESSSSEKGGDEEDDDASSGQGAGDEAGDDDAGEEDGDESGASDSTGDESEEGNGSGSDASDEAGEEDGDEAGEGEGAGDGEETEAGADAEPESSNDEPNRNCGEVIDAPEGEAGEQDQRQSTIVRQAAALAKAAGQMPGHADREIARDQAPRQDWRDVLRTYYDQGADRRETWNRPNRRFIGAGTILPGTEKEGLNTVVMLIDESGSVDDEALKCVSVETQAALDEGIIDRLIVIAGDTQVNHIAEHSPGDQIDFKFGGRGGTVMKPLFDWVRENVDNPSLIVCATDGFIESEQQLGAEPDCTVLWAFHGYPDHVKQHMAKAPWNAPSIDIGWH
jgi:predicted metal-dependent peptidase